MLISTVDYFVTHFLSVAFETNYSSREVFFGSPLKMSPDLLQTHLKSVFEAPQISYLLVISENCLQLVELCRIEFRKKVDTLYRKKKRKKKGLSYNFSLLGNSTYPLQGCTFVGT